MINPTSFLRSLKGSYYGDRFSARICETGTPRLHSILYSTTDGRIATRMRALSPPMTPSTSDKNLMNFSPVNPEFRRRLCTGRATRWALPRIFNYYSSIDTPTWWGFLNNPCSSEATDNAHHLSRFVAASMRLIWRALMQRVHL